MDPTSFETFQHTLDNVTQERTSFRPDVSVEDIKMPLAFILLNYVGIVAMLAAVGWLLWFC